MPGPPPPPPPPPPPGGAPGAPPPPPPPGGLPGAPPKAAAKNRGALLSDIRGGKQLKKAVTNDRSAPAVSSKSGSGGLPVGGAPPVPGIKAPSSLAPPVPGGGNRIRSNSDTGGSTGVNVADGPPQLAGLLAGGIPKLRKTSGGIDTGADTSHSDSETSRSTFARPPAGASPKPPRIPSLAAPAVPAVSALRPIPHSSDSSPSIPSPLANLKKPPPKPSSKPSISPIPAGKPPPPPPTQRKASGAPSIPPPPPPPLSTPGATSSPLSAPPPPPQPPPVASSPSAPSSAPPPPPSSTASPIPLAVRGNPPPPPINSGSHSPGASMAVKAAANAFARPSSSHLEASHTPSSPLSSNSIRSPLGGSSYTLTNGNLSSPGSGGRTLVDDNRWKFQDDNQLPPPRQFSSVSKRYRAGRGSTVPLDLSSLG